MPSIHSAIRRRSAIVTACVLALSGCATETQTAKETADASTRPRAPAAHPRHSACATETQAAKGRADESARARVFVASESSNSVTVIDGDSFQVVGTVDARNHATHDLAVSRDGRWLFATNLASGRLSAINTRALETVASIATGDRAHVGTLTKDKPHAC